jgi:signal recognition particle GTPase
VQTDPKLIELLERIADAIENNTASNTAMIALLLDEDEGQDPVTYLDGSQTL